METQEDNPKIITYLFHFVLFSFFFTLFNFFKKKTFLGFALNSLVVSEADRSTGSTQTTVRHLL